MCRFLLSLVAVGGRVLPVPLIALVAVGGRVAFKISLRHFFREQQHLLSVLLVLVALQEVMVAMVEQRF
jgi:hypothetical protein